MTTIEETTEDTGYVVLGHMTTDTPSGYFDHYGRFDTLEQARAAVRDAMRCSGIQSEEPFRIYRIALEEAVVVEYRTSPPKVTAVE